MSSNDEKWFRPNDLTTATDTAPIITGGVTVFPTAVGTALITIYNGEKTSSISLEHAVLVPSFPLNIFSGEELYLLGGHIARNDIVNRRGAVFASLDVKKRGFLLCVAGGIIACRGSMSVMLTEREVRETQLWHLRLAHSNYEAVNKTMKVRAEKSLNHIHLDLCEFKPATYDGRKHMLLDNDDKSRWKKYWLLSTKGSTSACIDGLCTELDTLTGARTMAVIQFDGGTEFINAYTQAQCCKRGTQTIVSPPYGHEQNGPIERALREVLEQARTTMIEADIPDGLFGEILQATVHIMNITASSVLGWKTPHEVRRDDFSPGDNKPSISHRGPSDVRSLSN